MVIPQSQHLLESDRMAIPLQQQGIAATERGLSALGRGIGDAAQGFLQEMQRAEQVEMQRQQHEAGMAESWWKQQHHKERIVAMHAELDLQDRALDVKMKQAAFDREYKGRMAGAAEKRADYASVKSRAAFWDSKTGRVKMMGPTGPDGKPTWLDINQETYDEEEGRRIAGRISGRGGSSLDEEDKRSRMERRDFLTTRDKGRMDIARQASERQEERLRMWKGGKSDAKLMGMIRAKTSELSALVKSVNPTHIARSGEVTEDLDKLWAIVEERSGGALESQKTLEELKKERDALRKR